MRRRIAIEAVGGTKKIRKSEHWAFFSFICLLSIHEVKESLLLDKEALVSSIENVSHVIQSHVDSSKDRCECTQDELEQTTFEGQEEDATNRLCFAVIRMSSCLWTQSVPIRLQVLVDTRAVHL